jgi:uncharacterized protein (DUF1330 family)
MEGTMNRHITVGLAMIAGAALGAAAMQGLHAQAKSKAYVVGETEPIDATANAAFAPLVRAAIKAAGGRSFNTAGGRIVALDGAAAPKTVIIVEWDSLEQGQAFYNSAAYQNIMPLRNKAQKLIRAYAVEAVN